MNVAIYPPTVHREKCDAEERRLADLGLTIIPTRLGAKIPAVSWRGYQRRKPTWRTRRRWFDRKDVGGLAVIHGAASAGLACRDFDRRDAYDRWATAHPRLAASLPTSISCRGPKVYFRIATESYRKLPDGELIGSAKHYSCLPPTIHPKTRIPYQWAIPLLSLPPVIDPIEAGLIPVELEQNRYPLDISNIRSWTQQLGVSRGRGVWEGEEGGLGEEIEGVIGRTLPTGYGQRNHCLFVLARRLKAQPECATAKAEELLPLVQRWHQLALPHIRTKDFAESWRDFAVAWQRVRSAGDGEVLVGVREWVCRLTDDPLLRLELACEAIQARQDGKPFYLACRTAADLIGAKKSTAAKLLTRLVEAGILHVEQASDIANRKAAVYAYRGPSMLSFFEIWRKSPIPNLLRTRAIFAQGRGPASRSRRCPCSGLGLPIA
jgi:hypothetical protein